MNSKFRNKYRSDSTRLQTWNYGWDAAYFITICTKGRCFYFGEVVNAGMELSPVGIIANNLWYEIKNHAKNVELGEFVVMPNHIHGIIILDGNDRVDPFDPTVPDTVGDVGTRHALSLPRSQQPIPSPSSTPSQPSQVPPFTGPPSHPSRDDLQQSEKTIGQQRYQNQGKNTISSIVGSYKSAVTKHCNRLELPFSWQTRFHDHIIRNGRSFERISEYIKNNPRNWEGDKFHEKNI